MGWRPEEGYYERHVEVEGYSNKITEEQNVFNRLAMDDISAAIYIVAELLYKENSPYKVTQKRLLDYLKKHIKNIEDKEGKENAIPDKIELSVDESER